MQQSAPVRRSLQKRREMTQRNPRRGSLFMCTSAAPWSVRAYIPLRKAHEWLMQYRQPEVFLRMRTKPVSIRHGSFPIRISSIFERWKRRSRIRRRKSSPPQDPLRREVRQETVTGFYVRKALQGQRTQRMRELISIRLHRRSLLHFRESEIRRPRRSLPTERRTVFMRHRRI